MRSYLMCLLTAFFLGPGLARAEAAPDVLVKTVTEEVLTILREDKDGQTKDEAIVLIENKVAPHFDFSRMTSLAVGRAWQQADPGQRKELTEQFRTLLVRTYANALTAYRDQTVSFKPLSDSASGDEVTVRSRINNPGSQPIALDYSLAKSAGDWKVFDVSVANVSLVSNYRSTFASELSKGGIDGLLKALQQKNRSNETAAHSAT
jgi:phospholipid transport system substrate-binding protein